MTSRSGQSGVYRGVSAEDRAAERRQRLLEATLEVWSQPGGRVTMTAVCSQARLTERYFYESFSGLDEALSAVLDEVADEIDRTAQAAADAAGPDPADRVRAAVRSFVELMVSDPRKGRVAIIEAGAMPALRARRQDLLRQFAHRAAEEARATYGETGWGPSGGEVAGLLFIGGIAELITAWLDGTVEVDVDELVETATALHLGLRG